MYRTLQIVSPKAWWLLCMVLWSSAAHARTAFIVAAPDMGFWGNEQIRAVYRTYAETFPLSRLVLLTRTRSRERFAEAVRDLQQAGADRIVVLPLILSSGEETYQRLQTAITGLPVHVAHHPWEDYLFSEILRDFILRSGDQNPEKEVLILLGWGAVDDATADQIRTDLQRYVAWLCDWARRFRSVHTLVLPAHPTDASIRKVRREIERAAQAGSRAIVVPFFFGRAFDHMMSTRNLLRTRILRGLRNVVMSEDFLLNHPNLLYWLYRESYRHLPLRTQDVGVVFMPHGADADWNDEIRRTLRPIESEFKVEYAMSMADAALVQRAVDRLTKRGVRYIIILRIFSLEESFRKDVEYMIGRQRCTRPMPGQALFRIRTPAILDTVGGIEDDPLYGLALVDQVRTHLERIQDPGLLLVAHGSGDDARNAHWKQVLASLAEQVQVFGGWRFSSVHVDTWREDWPDKRSRAVERIRRWLTSAQHPVILLEERVNGPGRAKEFLPDLNFTHLDEGFAPHPHLALWAKKMILRALHAALERRNRATRARSVAHVQDMNVQATVQHLDCTPVRFPGFTAHVIFRDAEQTASAQLTVAPDGTITWRGRLPDFAIQRVQATLRLRAFAPCLKTALPRTGSTGVIGTMLLVPGFGDLAEIPLEMVCRIEVVPGPLSTQYGSDAIGGVINVITCDAPEVADRQTHVQGRFRGIGGTYQTWTGESRVSIARRTWDVLVAAGRRKTDGPESRFPYRATSLFAKTRYRSSLGAWTLQASFYDETMTASTRTKGGYQLRWSANPTSWEDEIALQANVRLATHHTLLLGAGWRRERIDSNTRSGR